MRSSPRRSARESRTRISRSPCRLLVLAEHGSSFLVGALLAAETVAFSLGALLALGLRRSEGGIATGLAVIAGGDLLLIVSAGARGALRGRDRARHRNGPLLGRSSRLRSDAVRARPSSSAGSSSSTSSTSAAARPAGRSPVRESQRSAGSVSRMRRASARASRSGSRAAARDARRGLLASAHGCAAVRPPAPSAAVRVRAPVARPLARRRDGADANFAPVVLRTSSTSRRLPSARLQEASQRPRSAAA